MPDEIEFLRKSIKQLQQHVYRLEQQLETGKFKKVRCKRLSIVDERGREQVRIEAEQQGGTVVVLGKNGNPCVGLKVSPTGGEICIFTGDKAPLASVAGKGDQPGVRISVTPEGGSLTIYDRDGGAQTVP